ncbi:MAG: hypothetical protein C4538_09280 [Nitrospiraceae bacterium]|nr:MAG: hypothetical protein C4538_09280 [Nitrospiraceae bacterium]
MGKFTAIICTTLLLLTTLAFHAMACDIMNGEFEGDTSPYIVYDSQNSRFLMVYEKCVTSGTDIYGKLIKYDGTALGNEFLIAGDADPENPYSQFGASAAYDSVNKRFLVVWSDDRNDPGATYDVYGQIVNADGTLKGSNFAIADDLSDQFYPKAAFRSAGSTFLVIWSDTRDDAANYEIYGQLVNANGTINSSNVNITNNVNDQDYPDIKYDPATDKFFAVWSDKRNGTYDIIGQLLNGNASPSGGIISISTASGDQWIPSIALDNSNQRFFVTWYDFRNPCADPLAWCANADIYGQILNADGALNGSNFSIASNEEYPLYNPFAAFNSAEQSYLVAWYGFYYQLTDEGLPISAGDIHAQRVTTDGALDGGSFNISNSVYISNYSPVAAYNPVCENIMVAYWNDAGIASITATPIGACADAPPSSPELVSPANGAAGVNANITLTWNPSTDPDGDTVTYSVSYCTDPDFSGCDPVVVASLSQQNISYAGLGNYMEILGAGMFIAIVLNRRKKLIFITLSVIITGFLLLSCGGGGGGGGSNTGSTGSLSHSISSLSSGATYYWKVTADDGKGGTADSEIRSFSTR